MNKDLLIQLVINLYGEVEETEEHITSIYNRAKDLDLEIVHNGIEFQLVNSITGIEVEIGHFWDIDLKICELEQNKFDEDLPF